ncbi:PTS sugar transporter subunit IIA [candidate division KSB1 bacterium]
MNKCIILTHGDLGAALLKTTGKIIGEHEGIKVISNENTSLKDLIFSLEKAVEDWEDENILIMIDFCGGSCWHAAQVVKRNRENVALLSGVNLPILLAYINRRESYKLAELAEYLKESSLKGTSVICGLQPLNHDKENEE